MTTIAPELELLEELLIERTDPCQWQQFEETEPCEHPADWSISLQCAECGTGQHTLCTGHRDRLQKAVQESNKRRSRRGDPHLYRITHCEPLH